MKIPTTIFTLTLMSSCASLRDTMIIGGVSGAAIGAYTGALAYSGPHHEAQTKNIAITTSVGLGVGLLASYLFHKQVESRIEDSSVVTNPNVFYGDLPPNPFDVKPQPIKTKKGK